VEQDLAASFPDSRIVLNSRRLRDDLTKVVQFIAVPRDPLVLDLDICGTPFQRRVWDAASHDCVSEKPLTYAQTRPPCERPPNRCEAIAQACAENPIALAIPLSIASWATVDRWRAYRWGIKRKQALINKEVATLI